MSLTEAIARVQEIRAAVAPPVPPVAAAATAAEPDLFAARLETARAGQVAAEVPAARRAAATAPAPDVGAAAAGAAAPVPADLLPLVLSAARESGVEPALIAAVARAESGFDPRAVSPAGAQGIMQLMPATARGLGVRDPFDPAESLHGGAQYLRLQLDRFGDPRLALAAYNAGPAAVARAGGVPPYAETQAYVARVMAYYADFRARGLG